jgi:hypothetical protein
MSKTFRYSTISDFHKCQKYYELSHILGLSNGMDKLADLTYGTAIHLAVQDLFEGGNGHDVFEVSWDVAKGQGLEYGRLKHEDLAVLGKVHIEIFAAEHLKKFTALHLEKKLTAALGPHTLSGTVDFVGTYKGRLSIVDWKTAGFPYDAYKIRHNQQMFGYTYLAQQNLRLFPEQMVYGVAVKDMKNPRWQFKTQDIVQSKVDSVLDEIKTVCDDISTRTKFHKNVTQCMGYKKPCVFFEICHGGQNGDSAKEGASGAALCDSGPKTGELSVAGANTSDGDSESF